MSKLRPYLNDLPNQEKIKGLEQKIVDNELILDQLECQRQELEKSIALKRQEIQDLHNYQSSSQIENSSQIERIQKQVDHLENHLKKATSDILHTESSLFKLENALKDEIRNGMVELFHQAKLEYETAHKEWLRCEKSLNLAKDHLKKKRDKMETIEHVIRIEFDEL